MIELELFGSGLSSAAPSAAHARTLCSQAAARLGIDDGHVAIEFVDAKRIAQLNEEYRGKPEPTDVLSFPIDGIEPIDGDGAPRELGDIVICAEHTADIDEAIVHGMLHLLGMDHETDNGEMLQLQREILGGAGQ